MFGFRDVPELEMMRMRKTNGRDLTHRSSGVKTFFLQSVILVVFRSSIEIQRLEFATTNENSVHCIEKKTRGSNKLNSGSNTSLLDPIVPVCDESHWFD